MASAEARAFELTKIHCSRQERQAERLFLSEIHFKKANLTHNRTRLNVMSNASQYEGEVVSYSIHGSTRKYVSGYNLFSVFHRGGVISGLTGDPVTSADGVFTLSRLSEKNSGMWKFTYTNRHGFKIDADFKCAYNGNNFNQD